MSDHGMPDVDLAIRVDVQNLTNRRKATLTCMRKNVEATVEKLKRGLMRPLWRPRP